MKRRLLGAAAALALAAVPLRAEDLELLKKQTVQIRVDREDGSKEHGSGVILCQQDNVTYVLTAYHVFYGQSHDGRNYKASDMKTTEVRFYNDLAPKIVEDLDQGTDPIKVQRQLSDKDLLLFTVEVSQKLSTATPSNPPAELRDRFGRRLHGVTAVGLDWASVPGEMDKLEGFHLLHSARIEKGYSGGPLFDELGGLVGINVKYDPGSSEDDHAGVRTSRAVTLKEVERSIPLPPGCIESLQEDDSEEIAHEKYKKAMRALNLGRRQDAIQLLEEAKGLKKSEGGRRVHLQGMRYTEYLPLYHLGLAHFREGNYEAAHSQLAASFLQGVIKKGDKRYKTLIRLKKKAFDLRNAKLFSERTAELPRQTGQP